MIKSAVFNINRTRWLFFILIIGYFSTQISFTVLKLANPCNSTYYTPTSHANHTYLSYVKLKAATQTICDPALCCY